MFVTREMLVIAAVLQFIRIVSNGSAQAQSSGFKCTNGGKRREIFDPAQDATLGRV